METAPLSDGPSDFPSSKIHDVVTRFVKDLNYWQLCNNDNDRAVS